MLYCSDTNLSSYFTNCCITWLNLRKTNGSQNNAQRKLNKIHVVLGKKNVIKHPFTYYKPIRSHWWAFYILWEKPRKYGRRKAHKTYIITVNLTRDRGTSEVQLFSLINRLRYAEFRGFNYQPCNWFNWDCTCKEKKTERNDKTNLNRKVQVEH